MEICYIVEFPGCLRLAVYGQPSPSPPPHPLDWECLLLRLPTVPNQLVREPTAPPPLKFYIRCINMCRKSEDRGGGLSRFKSKQPHHFGEAPPFRHGIEPLIKGPSQPRGIDLVQKDHSLSPEGGGHLLR